MFEKNYQAAFEDELRKIAKDTSEKSLDNYEYLLHHIEIDGKGAETVHHCYLYDHIANLYEQKHLVVKNGKVYIDGKVVKNGSFHIITGLEPTQDITWSDEEAEKNKIKPKRMKAGMSHKEKIKEW